MASAAFADDVAAYLIDYEANHELQLTEDRLFNSKKGSDITVVCRGRSWYAHRSVICVQSDLLEKACDNVLKASGENRVDLSEHDPDALEAMLEYLYTGSFSDYHSSSAPAVFNVRVYSIAEKYDIYCLQTEAAEKFGKAVRASWNKVNLSDVIQEVLGTTRDQYSLLTNSFLDVYMEHAADLLNVCINTHFNETIGETPWRTAQLARVLSGEHRRRVYKGAAEGCNRMFISRIKPGEWMKRVCDSGSCHSEKDMSFTDWQRFAVLGPVVESYVPNGV